MTNANVGVEKFRKATQEALHVLRYDDYYLIVRRDGTRIKIPTSRSIHRLSIVMNGNLPNPSTVPDGKETL